MRERDAGRLLHAEDAHRQAADRARDAVAIGVEHRVVGRADVGDHVHLHAVDDGVEILALQAEFAHRPRQALQARAGGAPGIDGVDVGAPAVELAAALVARAARIRDVVDLPAERIDLEHRLALRARQDAHRGVERAAGRPLGGRRVWDLYRRQRSRILRFVGGREDAADAAACAPYQANEAEARDPRLAEMDALAQRIARAAAGRPAARHSVWMTATSSASRVVLDAGGERPAVAQQIAGAPRELVEARRAAPARRARRRALPRWRRSREGVERNIDAVESRDSPFRNPAGD